MGLHNQRIVIRLLIGMIVGLFVFSIFAAAAGNQEIQKTFKDKTSIKIQTIAASVVVKKSADGAMKFSAPANVKPVFTQATDTLIVKEEAKDAGKGASTWTLVVPDKVQIEFSSSSGGFTLSGLDTSLSIQTGTGNIKLQDVSGTITANSGTGNVELHNVAGSLKINDGTGNITADGIQLKGASVFMSGGGNVQVGLAKTAGFDLMISAATGKAALNYTGNPLKGYFEFQAKVSRGKITAPVPFSQEKEVDRSGEKYMIKSFSKDGNKPRIQVFTGSGQAILLAK